MFRRELEEIKRSNLYRRRPLLPKGVKNFCSNDYLGLRNHPKVLETAKKVLEEGLGSGASPLVSGYTDHHRKLEKDLSSLKEVPDSLLFGSGYLANVGTIPALAGEGDLILSDELNHASIIDGVRLSKAQRFIFRHRDYDQVRDYLKRNRQRFRRILIVTDGVFSMEGDTADLRALYEISEEFDCLLYIDDAHGTGTLGRGKGTIQEQGLSWKENVIVMGTLSKALGGYGAFVGGSRDLVEYLVNKARSLIFSTSLPPHVCAGVSKAVELIKENPHWTEDLRRIRKSLEEAVQRAGFEVGGQENTPIIPIKVGDELRAVEISKALLSKGFFVQAIRYPTVPKGKAILRVTASLRYSQKDIEEFGEALLSLA